MCQVQSFLFLPTLGGKTHLKEKADVPQGSLVPVKWTCETCPAVLLGLRMICWQERPGEVACWPFAHAPCRTLVEGMCLLENIHRKQTPSSSEGNIFNKVKRIPATLLLHVCHDGKMWSWKHLLVRLYQLTWNFLEKKKEANFYSCTHFMLLISAKFPHCGIFCVYFQLHQLLIIHWIGLKLRKLSNMYSF